MFRNGFIIDHFKFLWQVISKADLLQRTTTSALKQIYNTNISRCNAQTTEKYSDKTDNNIPSLLCQVHLETVEPWHPHPAGSRCIHQFGSSSWHLPYHECFGAVSQSVRSTSFQTTASSAPIFSGIRCRSFSIKHTKQLHESKQVMLHIIQSSSEPSENVF